MYYSSKDFHLFSFHICPLNFKKLCRENMYLTEPQSFHVLIHSLFTLFIYIYIFFMLTSYILLLEEYQSLSFVYISRIKSIYSYNYFEWLISIEVKVAYCYRKKICKDNIFLYIKVWLKKKKLCTIRKKIDSTNYPYLQITLNC